MTYYFKEGKRVRTVRRASHCIQQRQEIFICSFFMSALRKSIYFERKTESRINQTDESRET